MRRRTRVTKKHRGIVAEFGVLIRKKREARRLSQERLAELADLSKNYIGIIERGESEVSITALLKIAQGLNWTASELLRELGQ